MGDTTDNPTPWEVVFYFDGFDGIPRLHPRRWPMKTWNDPDDDDVMELDAGFESA
jgi:hypothetical protein